MRNKGKGKGMGFNFTQLIIGNGPTLTYLDSCRQLRAHCKVTFPLSYTFTAGWKAAFVKIWVFFIGLPKPNETL